MPKGIRRKLKTTRRRKTGFGRIFRKRRNNNNAARRGEVVAYIPRSLVSPIPPRYRTKMESEITFTWALGHQNLTLCTFINSAYQPFNVPLGGNHTQIGDTANNFTTITNAIPIAQSPVAFTQLCNTNFYRQYRVYSSSIELFCLPGVISDSVFCTITPSTTQGNPATIQLAHSQPNTKRIDFITSKEENMRSTLKHYMPVHKIMGITKSALQNDVSGQLVAAFNQSPSNVFWWTINVATIDGINTTSQMMFRIRMRYYLEFFDVANASMLQS